MKGRVCILLSIFLTIAKEAGSDQSRDTQVLQQGLGSAVDVDADQWTWTRESKGKDDGFGSLNVTIPLCCDVGMAYNLTIMKCEPLISNSSIEFHYEDGTPVNNEFAYHKDIGFPNCTSYSLQPQANPDDLFYLLPNGRLKIVATDDVLGADEFCMLQTQDEVQAIVCFQETNESFNHIVYRVLYPGGLIISAVFLAATLFVYCLVVELRDLLGRCLMCSVLALCVAQIWTVVVQLTTRIMSPPVCVTVGIMMHFWYLAAFLWLNVICFNVFLTVCRKSYLQQSHSSNRWFLIYSCYAWGLSFLVCALAVARDFSEGLQDSFLPKPNFGQARCWFSGDDALIIFFYGPTSVVLGVNVILFCVSAYKLCSISKSSVARAFQFSLYLKLFVLMGITWIFEVISFFVQRETYGSSSNYIWLVFDSINILQGVIIFGVFVCRRAVLARVCEVLCSVSVARKAFPGHYLNTEAEAANNETTMKHSVI